MYFAFRISFHPRFAFPSANCMQSRGRRDTVTCAINQNGKDLIHLEMALSYYPRLHPTNTVALPRSKHWTHVHSFRATSTLHSTLYWSLSHSTTPIQQRKAFTHHHHHHFPLFCPIISSHVLSHCVEMSSSYSCSITSPLTPQYRQKSGREWYFLLNYTSLIFYSILVYCWKLLGLWSAFRSAQFS